MSHRGIRPSIEEALGQIVGRVRHLETLEEAIGAPVGASYVTTQAEAGLTNESVLGPDVIMRGLAAARPAAGVAGRIYIEQDFPFVTWRDNGAGWDEIDRRLVYNVKTYGAVGNNIINDRDAIQAAIDAAYNDGGGIVYLPPLGFDADDRYRINDELELYCGVSLLGAHAGASRISAHGAFPILSYDTGHKYPDNGGWHIFPWGFFIKNLTLGFEDRYDDANARCIDFTAPSPNSYIIENVVLRNGYYGYYDTGGGFTGVFLRVNVSQCKVGIYKHGGGSSHQFYNVYVRGKGDAAWDERAWDVAGGVTYVLQACHMEKYYSNTDGIAKFSGNHSLTINGFGMEDCEAETNGNCIVWFDANFSTFVSGMKDIACVINAAAAGDTRLIYIYKNRMHFSACEIGGGTTVDAAGGGATGYAMDIAGTVADKSRVTITASAVVDPTSGVNAPTVDAIRLATAVNTVQLTLDNVYEGTVVNPNANSIFRHH